jgi:hypothetical protein
MGVMEKKPNPYYLKGKLKKEILMHLNNYANTLNTAADMDMDGNIVVPFFLIVVFVAALIAILT